ncbi:MAG: DMT family transporter, partial [Candidatus Roizmanbacteria bacterium]|nr:DMT family transporter [Candidatus Roizmanbacteria bacterium]
EPWIYLLVAVLFYGLYERLRFYITKALEASHLTIINNTSLVVAVIIAFFIYSEALTTGKILGFLLILTALCLISINKIKKINWSGVLLAVLANVFLGIGWALDKKGVFYFNAETYNVLAWILPLFILYLPHIKLNDLKKEIKISSWKIVFLSFFNVIGYFIQLKALALADATRVIPIVQTSTLFTVIFGIILLKEKENLLRKILAGIIAVIGVYFLTQHF